MRRLGLIARQARRSIQRLDRRIGELQEGKLRLPLRPGRYRYRFMVDGEWVTDPHNKYVETNQTWCGIPPQVVVQIKTNHAKTAATRTKVCSNGPMGAQSDISLRGISIFTCDLEEAARLNDVDPLVLAGRLSYDVMEWWVAAGTLAFPDWPGPVGDRRSMPDD